MNFAFVGRRETSSDEPGFVLTSSSSPPLGWSCFIIDLKVGKSATPMLEMHLYLN